MIMKNNSQALAETLFDFIVGYGRTVKRPKNASVDRALRNIIAESVIKRKTLIINSGKGYYVPGIDDAPMVREYVAKERAKAIAIMERVDAVEDLLDEMIKKALPEESTTKTTYIVNENRGECNGHMES